MQLIRQYIYVNFCQQITDGFCTHFCNKRVAPVFGQGGAIIALIDNLHFCKVCFFRVDHDISRKIENLLQIARRHIEQETHAARNTPEIPNMRDRSSQTNVSHPLASYFGPGYFYTALVADYATISDLFILTAITFPVLGRTENLFTKETVGLRFERSIVNGFRLFNFTVRPF